MMAEQYTEQEIFDARAWMDRVIEGVRYGNHAAESVLIRAYRTHGPRAVPRDDVTQVLSSLGGEDR